MIGITILLLATCNKPISPNPSPPASVNAETSKAPPTPPPPPLHQDVIKARLAVEKLNYTVFCTTLGKAMRNPKGYDLDYVAALIHRAETNEGLTMPMNAGIRGRYPVLGMNMCIVIAALGKADRGNRTVHRGHESYQLVYSDRNLYVYLDNNIVTSFQD
jgi:hypothetical protein